MSAKRRGLEAPVRTPSPSTVKSASWMLTAAVLTVVVPDVQGADPSQPQAEEIGFADDSLEEPTGQREEPAPATPATTLTAIHHTETPGGVLIHLEADGAITVMETFTLENPDRLVVDLPGLESRAPAKISVGTPQVSQVRVSAHPEKVRVVIDGGESAGGFQQRQVSPSPNGLYLALGSGPELEVALNDALGMATAFALKEALEEVPEEPAKEQEYGSAELEEPVAHVSWEGLAPSLSGPSGDRVAMVRTDLAPAIDGVLDDVAWAEAALLGPLTQVEPVVGAPTQRTEVRLLYDDDHLYVGIRCFDTEPDKIVAQVMLRDADLDPDDRVQMVFDTFHDRRNAFFFEVNPNGARGDGLVENSRKPNKDWDGIWYAKARIDEQGWTAEFALPFKTVSFDRGGKNWGFNLERVIRRNNEVLRWQAASQDRSLHDIGDAGVLTGLSGMSQGLGLDVSPSITVRPWDDRLGDNLIVDPSLDLRYRFTPSLTGTLTFNTDFAETEVDEREVNLTRFDLFFPEKREFFLQDAGIFEFGGIKKNGRPFFSRRIGINEEGETVPIWFGGKVSGRIGPWNIGFLDTQIDSDGEVDSSNLLVTRVSRNVLEESGVGMIFTNGDPLTNDDNWLVGADFNYRITDFLDEQILTANAWFQKSSTEGVNSRENAFGVRVDYPNDIVEAALGFFEIQENFNPALGFVNRRGIRQYEGDFRYRVRPHGMIRTVDTGFEFELFTDDKDNRVETGALDIIVVRLENDAEDSVELHSVLEHEVLEEEFDIVDDVLIPPDTYTWWKGGVVIETATSRPLSGGLEFFWGEFYRGHRTEIKPSLAWAPSKHFLLVLEYETNFVRLEEGNFTTYLARGRFNIQFTPDLSWNTLMQWDNESNLFGINTRFRWIVEEGNEISLVFNHNALVDSGQYRATFNEVLTKVKWTFRF